MNVEIKPQKVSVSISTSSAGISVGNQIVREYVGADPYEGEYEITPTTETQTLLTKNFRMIDNLIINPVPSNYGLITWNGSTITVS